VSGLDTRRAEAAVRRRLNGKRLDHTLAVRQFAVRLARIHAVPVDKVEIAALLHDWAKGAAPEELPRLAEAGAVEVDEETLAMPPLHHAYLSAYWIEEEFGVHDPEILEAVRHHSTGSPGLGPVGRVVFVADYAEPGRKLRQTDAIRAVAEEDLDEAVRRVLQNKLTYLIGRGRPIHRRAWLFWNALMEGAR